MPACYPYHYDCRYRTRGRARPRRPSPRVVLLRFLARHLTEAQMELARTVEDVDALRFIAEGFGVRA